MRRAIIGGCLLVGIVYLASPVARGCGDKTLAMGIGVRFGKVNAALRPASILIYTTGNLGGGAKDVELQETLKAAGHKLQTVADSNSLHQVLKSGKYDLVLADVSGAAGLEQEAQSAPSRPTVVPVLFKSNKPARAAAEKQYGVVLNVPGNGVDNLKAIDRIMKQRGSPAHS